MYQYIVHTSAASKKWIERNRQQNMTLSAAGSDYFFSNSHNSRSFDSLPHFEPACKRDQHSLRKGNQSNSSSVIPLFATMPRFAFQKKIQSFLDCVSGRSSASNHPHANQARRPTKPEKSSFQSASTPRRRNSRRAVGAFVEDNHRFSHGNGHSQGSVHHRRQHKKGTSGTIPIHRHDNSGSISLGRPQRHYPNDYYGNSTSHLDNAHGRYVLSRLVHYRMNQVYALQAKYPMLNSHDAVWYLQQTNWNLELALLLVHDQVDGSFPRWGA
jgi:hypothetical protein